MRTIWVYNLLCSPSVYQWVRQAGRQAGRQAISTHTHTHTHTHTCIIGTDALGLLTLRFRGVRGLGGWQGGAAMK